MSPVLLVMQGVVAVVAVQTLVLLAGVAYLVHWLRCREAERRRRDRALRMALAAEIAELRTTVRAARAEAATYLEAVFTGVRQIVREADSRGSARPLDPDENRSEVVHLRDLTDSRRRPGSTG
ncbi:MAG TPA: hypothetical protein VLW85_15245 [Myxococcales bacterium]|nr:hypothetical protein [Myxococcales bacterium]